MAWTAPSGHVWTTGEVVTAASMNTYLRLNLEDLDRRTTVTGASVATSEATTSTTYVDLATVGPAVTVTIGASGLALVLFHATGGPAGGSRAHMAYAVSGATTVAAADATGAFSTTTSGTISAAVPVSGLTAGSNTFTAKYRSSGGASLTFADRVLTVVPLGS